MPLVSQNLIRDTAHMIWHDEGQPEGREEEHWRMAEGLCSPLVQMEYVKLWKDHSGMFWSRLQTAALIHSGVLVAWYTSGRDGHTHLPYYILVLGILLGCCLLAAMIRDAQYMDVLRQRSGHTFPSTHKKRPAGRWSGYLIVVLPLLAEVLLLASPVLRPVAVSVSKEVLYCYAQATAAPTPIPLSTSGTDTSVSKSK